MTVIDVGANIGWLTLLSAKLVGKEGKSSPSDRTLQAMIEWNPVGWDSYQDLLEDLLRHMKF